MNHFIAGCHQQNKRGVLALFSVREKMKEEKKIQMMVSLPIVLIWERELKKREQESIKKLCWQALY